MRLIASHDPRSAPYRPIASAAYWEQVGVNRQWLPRIGLSRSWYSLIRNCKSLAIPTPETIVRRRLSQKLAVTPEFGYNFAISFSGESLSGSQKAHKSKRIGNFAETDGFME